MDAIEATITAGLIGTGTVGQLHAACGSGQTLVVPECARWLVTPGGVAVAVVPLIALTDTLSVRVRPKCRDRGVQRRHGGCRLGGPRRQRGHHGEHQCPDTHGMRLGRGGDRVVVSTYVSADRIAGAFAEAGLIADLLAASEGLSDRGDWRRRLSGAENAEGQRHCMCGSTRGTRAADRVARQADSGVDSRRI